MCFVLLNLSGHYSAAILVNFLLRFYPVLSQIFMVYCVTCDSNMSSLEMEMQEVAARLLPLEVLVLHIAFKSLGK